MKGDDGLTNIQANTEKRHSRIRSAQFIPLSFLGLILLGTLLLVLPISSSSGQSNGVLTSLFTSTTSVCVTGLVVVDTYSSWSLFGQVVILLLIQIGGLGVLAVVSILMAIAGSRLSLQQSLFLHDSFSLDTMSGALSFLKRVFRGTLMLEGVGALFYMIRFIPEFGIVRGIWYSIFTAVSAFCNAGIDILGPTSLMSYDSDPLVLIVTMVLITMGGLGFVVWFDLFHTAGENLKNHRPILCHIKRLSVHTRLVLLVSAVLTFGGAAFIFVSELGNPDTIGSMTLGDQILNALFQSVTLRTAGFATVPQESLNELTCLGSLGIMFVGGSPVGAAGGVKTVTAFVLLANAVAYIRGRRETVVFNREITPETVRRASAVVIVSFVVTFVIMCALMATDGLALTDAGFEIVSATATVGLSRGITPTLSAAGKLLVIIAMYLGRIGPISMVVFFSKNHSKKNVVKYAEGKIVVG